MIRPMLGAVPVDVSAVRTNMLGLRSLQPLECLVDSLPRFGREGWRYGSLDLVNE
jgi:hypothetical protein